MSGERRRLGGALGASAAVHAGLVLVVLISLNLSTDPAAVQRSPAEFQYIHIQKVGALGGGGGHRAAAPPRPIEIPPSQPRPPVPTAMMLPLEQPKPPTLDAVVETNLASVLQASGKALVSLAGPGGGRPGDGLGKGRGDGVDEGEGGRSGGGPRQVGGGVTGPALLRQVEPAYTNDGVRRKIQGTVTLLAVVRADGTVGDVRVLTSLEPGMDQEAIKAAKKWLFRPGTEHGKPVDVYVNLVLDFRIH